MRKNDDDKVAENDGSLLIIGPLASRTPSEF